MSGPAAVLALVLAEAAAGGVAFLFLTPLWNEVRRGFFYLTGGVVLVLSLSAAGAAAAGLRAGAEEGRLGVVLAVALAAATFLWLVLMMARRHAAGRVVGVATVPVAVAMLVAFARVGQGSTLSAAFQLLAGAAFTGAVLDGLLLGHWYLTDRRLPRGPINRMTALLIAAVALETPAVILSFGASTGETGRSLSPLLAVAGVASWIALGMVACTALIAAFIRLTLRGDRPAAVQSATGFFYLAVITGFTAELAAKVRFLP